MTDVLAPPVPADAPAGDDVDATTHTPAAVALAALSTGAAIVHVAMAPPHVGDSVVLGAGFVVVAWAQLAVGVFALARPGRRVWLGAVALHTSAVVVWAFSRTAGLPLGEHAGHPEAVTLVDAASTGFELAAVVMAMRLLARRGLPRRLGLVAAPVLVIAATSLALASPDARGHAHGDDAGHAHDGPSDALAAVGFGSFMNGHEHNHVETTLDPVTQAELDRELAVTRSLARAFPTVQHALDAGYRRAGPYTPGLGLHLLKIDGPDELNGDGLMDDAALRHPMGLLYLHEEPSAPLTGFMYYAATAAEPAGFAGRNDGWHYHEDICVVSTASGIELPFGPDLAASDEQCTDAGGALIDRSGWMLHVWSVPDFDEMDEWGGVFAEMSPYLGCSDGTYFILPFDDWVGKTNVCRSGAPARLDPKA